MKQPHLLRVVGQVMVVAAFAVASSVGQAQTQSLFGSRGPASQIGSNLTGSSVGRRSTFGTSGGAFGSTGLSGQPVTGGTTGGGFGQAGGAIQQGQAGTQGAFIGRDDNAGRFVGNRLAGQQTQFSSSGAQFRNFGARGGGAGRSEASFTQGRNRRGQTDSSRLVFRPRQRIAFSYPRRESSSIAAALTTRFNRLSSRAPGLDDVNVVLIEEGTVTLQGEVNSAETKRLATILARLEPGVRDVRNELTVRNEPSTGPSVSGQ